jgi:hypothetical protein
MLAGYSVHKLEFIEERKRSNERSKDGALSCKHRANLLAQDALRKLRAR